MELRTNRVVFIVGMRGYGKTLFAARYAKRLGRVIFLDTANTFGKQDTRRLVELAQFQDSVEHVLNGRLRFVKILCTDFAARQLFATLCRCIDAQTRINATLVVDEAQRFMTPNHIIPELAQLVAEGRHIGLNLVFVARQFTEINKRVRSQCDEVFSFRQEEYGDLRIAATYNRRGMHYERYLPQLPRDKFIKLRG